MTTAKLIVHGGTAMQPVEDEPHKSDVLKQAVVEGMQVLTNGGSAPEAVVAAVALLEDSGLFLAGRGATPQSDRVIRYDASLMSSDARAGSVQSVRFVDNPIIAARTVYDRLRHTSIVGPPAEEILQALGLSFHPRTLAPRSVDECVAEHLKHGGAMFGTVGAVAMDPTGLIASGTSTGGYPAALPGRVGDSGAIGIGTVATSRCGVSCTGDGDRFLCVAPSSRIDAMLDLGVPVQRAIERTFALLHEARAVGGFIMLSSDGRALAARNVPILRVAASETVEESIFTPISART